MDPLDPAPDGTDAVVTLIVVAIGEITQSPRYYEYVSRLAPLGQQGTYMVLPFFRLALARWSEENLEECSSTHFGEVTHQPDRIWWSVTGVGVATAASLWIYDKTFKPRRHYRQSEGASTVQSTVEPNIEL